LHISKCSFSRKVRFSAESTPHCGALHFRAALEHLHFFKVKMLSSFEDVLFPAFSRCPPRCGCVAEQHYAAAGNAFAHAAGGAIFRVDIV
ncbi:MULTISPECIES: hypothetical protein, partial [unclassified Desulfovibrio]|uniref:hypothetical protein n=1 Tax=unclassified Desulfovibrio TaxID=2593640 RepID=UPI002FDB6600